MSGPIQIEKKNSWKLFDQIATTYDLLNRFISLGADVFWRKQMAAEIVLRPGVKMQALDLATGTADVAVVLAKMENIARVEGVDRSREMLAVGREKVQRRGLEQKVSLTLGDAMNLDYPSNHFDLVTLAFGVRNFAHVEQALSGIYRVLKSGGQLLVMEFGLPRQRLIRVAYLCYLRAVLPLVGRMVSRHPFAYSYLNRTVESFPYGDEFLRLLEKAGFCHLRARSLCFGVTYIYSGSK